MPSKLHILKAVRYDRKCFHDSLNRTTVISGNEKLTEATVRKPVSSHSVNFPFRVILFRLLPFRLLYQKQRRKCTVITSGWWLALVMKSFYLSITVLIRSWVTTQSLWKNLTLIFFEALMYITITYNIIWKGDPLEIKHPHFENKRLLTESVHERYWTCDIANATTSRTSDSLPFQCWTT